MTSDVLDTILEQFRVRSHRVSLFCAGSPAEPTFSINVLYYIMPSSTSIDYMHVTVNYSYATL
jgi:hypothetical protein